MLEAAPTEADGTPAEPVHLTATASQVAAGLQVGGGVPRGLSIGGDRPKVKAPELKAKPAVWHSIPQYPDQIQNADEVKQVSMEVHVLDLSLPKDLDKYQSLLNLELQENASRYVLKQERRYDEKGARFLVYIEVGVFQFKEFLPSNLHGKRN